jgi:hypothetical protein
LIEFAPPRQLNRSAASINNSMSDNLNEHKTENAVEGWECDACGADVSSEDTFCRNCGSDISEVDEAEGLAKMNETFTPMERNSIAACCGLSILLFFFPLLTIRIPIAGDQDVSGYDVFSKLTEFREKLTPSNPGLSSPSNTASPRSQALQDPPLSVKLAWLILTALIAAFLSAAVTLIAAFKDVRIARATSAFGTLCCIAAILHITIMNSDIRSWLSDAMQTSHAELKDNPFAGLAETLGTLIVNAFQIKPGWALYALLLLSGVAAALGFSRVLSRLRVMPSANS